MERANIAGNASGNGEGRRGDCHAAPIAFVPFLPLEQDDQQQDNDDDEQHAPTDIHCLPPFHLVTPRTIRSRGLRPT
jgi:hypothetical protein